MSAPTAWLVTRRNDVVLRFPLVGRDRRFLAEQLRSTADAVGERGEESTGHDDGMAAGAVASGAVGSRA